MLKHPNYHPNTAEALTLDDAISMFLRIGLAAASPQTVDWYKKRLDLFQKGTGIKYVAELNEDNLWFWYVSLQRRVKRGQGRMSGKISVNTQHGYIRAVRRFIKWLFKKNILEANFAQDLKLPRLPKNGKKGVNDHDVDILLKATSSNLRDYAILRFIESTGCRRGGVSDLRLSDLDIDADEPLCRRAIVREKGEKERTVFMSAEALDAMKKWLKQRKSQSDFVFVNSHNPDRGISPSGVSSIIARYKKQTGITGQVSPHQWRHRLGRKLTQAGMPLGLVSQTLGHASVVVTNDFYGIFAVDELQKAVDRYYKSPKLSK